MPATKRNKLAKIGKDDNKQPTKNSVASKRGELGRNGVRGLAAVPNVTGY